MAKPLPSSEGSSARKTRLGKTHDPTAAIPMFFRKVRRPYIALHVKGRRGRKSSVAKAAAPKPPVMPVAGAKKKKRKKKLKRHTFIAARIIDKLPNGTLLLEGHKLVEINKKVRQILISGYVNESDINARGEVDSRKMADLSIDYVIAAK